MNTSATTVAAAQTSSVEHVHRVNLHEFLTKQDGRFVSVTFTKVNGCARKLNGRLGVRKHLRGGDNRVEGTDRPYMTVYDVKHGGYRAINLATVGTIRAQNREYVVIG